MKRFTLICFCALTATLITGCASVSNVHRTYGPDGKPLVEDVTKAKGVLNKTAVEKLAVSTQDAGGYKHTLSGSGLQNTGDVEMLRELRGIFKDMAEVAAKAAVPIPGMP